ncbi:MAG TPA: DUF885 domain-containing protein [Gammaproteobacteria bacterium]|nr:DUF885 domain-containing protein [Gammaproteobacteria bacterium]
MKLRSLTIPLAAAVLLAAGCGRSDGGGSDGVPTPAAAPAASATWDAFRDRFIEGFFELNPSYAVYQGRHEFDGRISDWSTASLQRQMDFLRAAIADAEAFDTTQLSAAQSFERDYLASVARGELFWLEDADQPHANVSWYFDNGLDPGVYTTRPYADAATRLRAFVAHARAVPVALAQIRANLRTPLPLSFVEFGVAGFNGYAEYYRGDGTAAFASVGDTALQAELAAAAETAATAMTAAAAWLETQRAMATQDFALGAERFARMLAATEDVTVPLDALEALGRADLRRNQDALREACATFAPGATLGDCMAKMAATKSPLGPVAEARTQLPALKQFLLDTDLVSIPGSEEALVEEAPPYNRQNAAYIDIPGPYEKGLPSVYYIAPPDPSWTAEEQLEYVMGSKDLLFTSVHEVWPGHFLNFLHSNRASLPIARVFYSYAAAEGWGHYAEELVWEAGFEAGNAESHIGQLSNALLRNCRYVSAIGLHTRGMTQQQSYELFRNECFQDEGNSRQQAARGTYDPAYLNYTLGKLMIRKLRDDWTASRGGRQAWKSFHDTFLSYGGPPIPLVRRAMLGDDSPPL